MQCTVRKLQIDTIQARKRVHKREREREEKRSIVSVQRPGDFSEIAGNHIPTAAKPRRTRKTATVFIVAMSGGGNHN